jgi:acetate kinase
VTPSGPSRILVVNAGSSSLKLRLLDEGDVVVETADLPAVRGAADAQLVADAVSGWAPPGAVGHRVVHGGERFSAATVLDDPVVAAIAALSSLAPLHNPSAVAAIEAVRTVLPGRPHVACFDTAFHATLPAAAATYALPAAWRERWPLRRYGFHGLNHAYVSRRAAELSGRSADASFRVVTCHLGAGSSLAAVVGGRSVDTTMGFTPLEGLVMATRSGDVDPGLLLWLEREGGLTADELSDGLEHQSGLLGLGGTDDMRSILASAATSDAARLARDAWAHRLRASIAAMAASMGGLDALVFTAGIGERSAEARALACDGLSFLGVALDPAANARSAASADTEIGGAGAGVRVFVIPAREDVEIARQVRALVEG